MSFLGDVWDTVTSNPVKTVGTGLGFMAGLPAGIFGGIGGAYVGNQVGNIISPDKAAAADYSGMTPYPTYVGMSPDATQVGMSPAMAKYASEAMRTGPTQGTELALKQNQENANLDRAQAMKGASGLAANAESNLAMKGGMGAGARERIGKYASDVGMSGMNSVDQNAGQNRTNLLVNDEASRLANLNTAGMEGTGLAQQNLQNKQAEFNRRNAYNLNLYDNQMAAWGAGKTADAVQNSGKHGMFK